MELVAEVYKGGRVTLPKSIREQFGVEQGSQLTFRIKNDQITILTEEQLLAEARASLKKELPAGCSLVDELLAERRAEVLQEQAGYGDHASPAQQQDVSKT